MNNLQIVVHILNYFEDNQIVMGYPAVPFRKFLKKNNNERKRD